MALSLGGKLHIQLPLDLLGGGDMEGVIASRKGQREGRQFIVPLIPS